MRVWIFVVVAVAALAVALVVEAVFDSAIAAWGALVLMFALTVVGIVSRLGLLPGGSDIDDFDIEL